MLYMVTFTINIPQMLAYIPYMDPMGYKHTLWHIMATFPFSGHGGHHDGSAGRSAGGR